MNWIAEQFEKLKARVEEHIPAAHKALNDLGSKVDGTAAFVSSAVSSVESKVSSVESRLGNLESVAVRGVELRVQALEMKLAELAQAKAIAP
jgi:hypothetical protein